jgi:F-type H+-transporting ATPase subunit gamma
MLKVLNGLVSRVDPDAHPLLRMPAAANGAGQGAPKPGEGGPDQAGGRPLLIIISGDRGLSGSFNSNVIKAAGEFIGREGRGREVALGLVGRKGRDFFRRRGFDVRYEVTGIFQKLSFADATKIANVAIDEFTSGQASSVYLVYNEFKSVMTQRIVLERLLPIPRLEFEADQAAGPDVDYLYEPTPEEIFRDLLPRHVQVQVYRALLESNAAFYAAQMTAMDAATRNSADMIESLTLYMNKVRQAAITREIIEVVSGASAT